MLLVCVTKDLIFYISQFFTAKPETSCWGGIKLLKSNYEQSCSS